MSVLAAIAGRILDLLFGRPDLGDLADTPPLTQRSTEHSGQEAA